MVFASLDLAAGQMRSSNRQGRAVDKRNVFAAGKPAEANRRSKRG